MLGRSGLGIRGWAESAPSPKHVDVLVLVGGSRNLNALAALH